MRWRVRVDHQPRRAPAEATDSPSSPSSTTSPRRETSPVRQACSAALPGHRAAVQRTSRTGSAAGCGPVRADAPGGGLRRRGAAPGAGGHRSASPGGQLRPLLVPSLITRVVGERLPRKPRARRRRGAAPDAVQPVGHRDHEAAAEVFGSYSRGARMHAIACGGELPPAPESMAGGRPSHRLVRGPTPPAKRPGGRRAETAAPPKLHSLSPCRRSAGPRRYLLRADDDQNVPGQQHLGGPRARARLRRARWRRSMHRCGYARGSPPTAGPRTGRPTRGGFGPPRVPAPPGSAR